MGLIRTYSRAYRTADVGDPFSLRIPRKLRKLQVGRALGKVATTALSFVPGLGSILSPLAQRIVDLGKRYGVDQETMLGFARSYGLDVGDPGGVPQRDMAAATPKQKAKAKATKKATPKAPKAGTKPGQPSAKKSSGGKNALGIPNVPLPPGLGEALSGLAQQVGLPGGGKALGLVPGAHRAAGGRHRRQTINLTALNHALARVNKFEKVVQRVQRSKPMRRFARHAPPGGSRMRGHKPGCGCVTCRRAA